MKKIGEPTLFALLIIAISTLVPVAHSDEGASGEKANKPSLHSLAKSLMVCRQDH